MLMRRIGLVLFAAVLLLTPCFGDARPPASVPRLGYLVLAPLSEPPSPERAAFLDGLRELGWVDGKTIAIVYRSAQWNPELFDDLAEELVRMKVDVIVTAGGIAAPRAAQKSSRTIPIVMAAISDPLVPDLVASLARPGGNVTGVSLMAPELGPKRLELLAEAAPRASRVAVLWNPTFRDAASEFRSMQNGTRALGLTLRPVEVKSADDLARAFAVLEKERPDALFAEAGGLIWYSPNVAAGFRRAAAYVDRILKGAKPGDLPVEQPTKFELVINVKTAGSIGLTIPPSLLLRADQVIE